MRLQSLVSRHNPLSRPLPRPRLLHHRKVEEFAEVEVKEFREV